MQSADKINAKERKYILNYAHFPTEKIKKKDIEEGSLGTTDNNIADYAITHLGDSFSINNKRHISKELAIAVQKKETSILKLLNELGLPTREYLDKKKL